MPPASRRGRAAAGSRLPLGADEVPEEADIEEETGDAGDTGRQLDRSIAAEIGVDGGGEEPELEQIDEDDEQEDAVDDRHALAARGVRAATPSRGAHVGPPSMPVAHTVSPRISRVTRGSGRRGGPASGRPVARSNQPL